MDRHQEWIAFEIDLAVLFEVMHQNEISYQIHTFGSLQIHSTNAPVPLTGEKSRNLLAYLILHPRLPHRREMLADLLWPDAPRDRIRRNLSDVLYRLQKLIPTEWLVMESDTIAFRPNADVWVDVWEFDHLAAGSEPDKLQKAVDLYTRDLLLEIYDEWILAERELRRSQYLSALENLSRHYETQGNLQQALLFARRLILAEPLQEPAHQAYLRLLGRLRRFGEATAHYEYLCQLIRSELDLDLMAETRAIMQSLERERDLDSMPFPVEEVSPFVGRKAERAAALAAVEDMLSGNGGILAIEGEAGMGKSRLLREIAAGARWRGAGVLQGGASESLSVSPYSPLAEALGTLINSPRGQQLEALLTQNVLATLAPLHPAWSAKHEPQETRSEQDGKRFSMALQLLGETLVKLTPILLILDDVHWATPVLWEALRMFVKGFVWRGGLVVLAYRRLEIEKLAGWEILQSWDRDGILKTISLEPLRVEDVAQLVPGTDIDPSEIHSWTGGNPFFIHEWLAEPEQKRPVSRAAISLRLQAISPAARAALESAAVLGESIPYQLWAEVAGLPPITLAALTDELTAGHWLQPSVTGYAFLHDLIHTAVYQAIEPDRRQTLHERAARAYEQFEPENARSLAFHLDRAELHTEAPAAYRRAGEQDLARFAYREAQTDLERALELMPQALTLERMETMLSLARALDVLGERTKQLLLLKDILSGAEQLRQKPLRLRTLLALGRAKNQTNQYVDAEKHLLAALELARKMQDDEQRIEAYLLLGMNRTGLRHTQKSLKYYKRAWKLAQKISSPAQEARALRGLGIAARDAGSPADSIKWLERALAVQHRIGDRLGQAVTQSNLVTAFYDLGAWDQLIATAEDVLPQVEALGYRYNAGYLRHLQGLAFYNLGEYSSARQQFIKAAADFEATGEKTAFVDGVLGLIAEDEGDTGKALRHYRKALASIESTEDRRELPVLQLDFGALLWRLEQPREAITHLEAAREIWLKEEDKLSLLTCEAFLGLARLTVGERARAEELAANGWAAFQAGIPAGEKPQSWLWALYQLLVELEQLDSARLLLQAAYDELQRQAGAISNLELRRSFFRKVPLNRSIVAARDQLTKTTRVIAVSLAHFDVSLGRSLRADEYVRVHWTIGAPEDESIRRKTAQRQYRLKRLLQESEAQQAAPTDTDLARALGVSRRTIVRDMQILSGEISHLPTRKRKSSL